ncbi:NineTeen Complex (NTC) component [Coelomomyces lativittatus]|nr:NineTeen Complex (NTC) component [Coelomomyces lativittatus]KAJ1516926.1 NineTeen Complex (NTC) component [Coelomomyces lativittatus]
MARNQEKAQSMLYRFREAEMAELGLSTTTKRPTHTRLASTLQEAEKWRGQVIRDITRKVTRIHDPGLNDGQIRELNDEINKFFKEKWQWEKRILELGGTDYSKMAARMLADGKELPGMKGYKYFGRARELPEVKELFEKMSGSSTGISEKIKFDRSRLDAEYFGYLDDPELQTFETTKEKELFEEHTQDLDTSLENIDHLDPLMKQLYDGASSLHLEFVHSVEDVEQWILEKRKKELLSKLLNA